MSRQLIHPLPPITSLSLSSESLRALPLTIEVDHSAFQRDANLLASWLKARHRSTWEHGQRVASYVELLGHALGWDEEVLSLYSSAALLHDLGKASLPLLDLDKPGRFDEAEQKEIRRHPLLGARILLRFKSLTPLVLAALYHHERWDGSGYPFGLSGREIPQLARVVSVADSYDAMTSERPYKRTLTHREAATELIRGSDTQFDGALVDAFLTSLKSEQFKRGTRLVA